ncbi:MAG: hypothetical protein KDD35_12785, partial [Bdellovibrionales bacterium]|nr:hypothetical protein [Bdellovibrionales bacterium]
WITGKLSDFFGMFYFPLFLCGIFCFFGNFAFGRRKKRVLYVNKGLMIFAIVLSALLMILVNLDNQISANIERIFNDYLFGITLTADKTDLLSLCVLPLSYWYASKFFPFNDELQNSKNN